MNDINECSERNRQTGRTTALTKYALKIGALFICHNTQAAIRVLSEGLGIDVVTAGPRLITVWRNLDKPPIVVDHTVWEFGDVKAVVELLKEASKIKCSKCGGRKLMSIFNECGECGAHVRFFQNSRGTWMPFNVEDIDDDFDPHTHTTHWKTCKRQKPEVDLTYKQRTRPGYL